MNNNLQDMNIFHILGVDGTEEEKQQFVDEMQEVVWDAIARDYLDGKISDEELDQIESVIADEAMNKDEKLKILDEKLRVAVPNLDQVILDKTNALKADLLQERIGGMLVRFQDNPEAQTKLNDAQTKYDEQQFEECVTILGSIQ